MFKKALLIQALCLSLIWLGGCGSKPEKLPPMQWANQAPPGAQVSPAPRMRVGDYWEYKVTNGFSGKPVTDVYSQEVVAANPDGAFKLKITHKASGRYHYKHFSPNYEYLGYQYENSARTPGIDLGRYSFPMWVAKRWISNFSLYNKAGQPQQYTNQFIVMGFEPVQAGGKTYQAFKVRLFNQQPVYLDHANPAGVIKLLETDEEELQYREFWYAPTARIIVKYQNQAENYSEELMLFRPGR